MIVLASQSPRRRQLLSEAGVDFLVDSAQGGEAAWDGVVSPEEYTRGLAVAKATEVSLRHPGALTIGADTVVALENRIYGKPADMTEAVRMLKEFSGREHRVVTGVAFVQDGRELRSWCSVTQVRFQELTEERIQEYFALVNPLDKAGAYGIQEHGRMLVESIRGLYSNVVGFPIEEVMNELRERKAL